MNIIDVYFGKSDFLNVHVRLAFVLTSIVQFNMGHILIFQGFFACMLLDIWEYFHTPNARWLAYWFAHFDI
jgi:hypothetical protein